MHDEWFVDHAQERFASLRRAHKECQLTHRRIGADKARFAVHHTACARLAVYAKWMKPAWQAIDVPTGDPKAWPATTPANARVQTW